MENHTIPTIEPALQSVTELLEFGAEGMPNKDEALGLAEKFLNNLTSIPDPEDQALASYLYLIALAPQLPIEINNKLNQVIGKLRFSGGALQDTLDKIQITRQEVHGYFRHQSHLSDYFVPGKGETPLAELILDIQLGRIAEMKSSEPEFKYHSDWVIEKFNRPKDNLPGIWMSTKGIHFDPSRLS